MERQLFTGHSLRLILCIISLHVVISKTQSSTDWRIVPYEDLHLMASTRMFEQKGMKDFARFTPDVSSNQIIVGIRDNLLRLRLSDLSLIEAVSWPSDDITVSICLSKGQSKEDCHNFIRVLVLRQNSIFVCGTNSYSPQCSWRKVESMSVVDTWVTGVAKCPYSPHQNSTSIMTADGNFYSATVTDFTGRDAAIYRMLGPSRHLRTVQYNSRWLNEPDFVSSYEIGEYIYFFFREVAVEYINCGKAIYSRVARICKSDYGGRVLLEDNWTTFVKARLNCSLPGNYPFYYNELQSTYYDENLQLIFAVLTTSATSIYGSAMCIYNLTAFDSTFTGSFKYQESAQTAWARVPNNPSSPQCSRDGMTLGKRASENLIPSLVEVQKFQMMDSAVQPSSHIPPLLAEKERFTHIVVDRVKVSFQSVKTEVFVLFVATLEGSIKKFFLLPQPVYVGGTYVSVCLLEELQLMPSDLPQPIRQLDLIRSHGFLLVGTSNRLYQIPTQRCYRFTSKILCENMQDPYCQWNDVMQECQATGNGNLSSCPRLHFTVAGQWSSWSAWQPCSSPVNLTSAEDEEHGDDDDEQSLRCFCRTRSCDNPKPSNAGEPCVGRAMQVINCTQATQKTVRQWSSWSDWTKCSSVCGDGHQTRLRTCLWSSLQPNQRSHACVGAEKKMRVCNVKKCPEVSRMSEWSSWYVTGSNKDGFREQRLRCSCDSVHGQQQIARLVTDLRFCLANGQNCSGIENQMSNISSTKLTLSCPDTKCEKRSEPKKQENTITKGGESNLALMDKTQHKSNVLAKRTVSRSSYPRGFGNFHGYCGCRDLGMLHICYRCHRPFGPLSTTKPADEKKQINADGSTKFDAAT